MAEVGAAIIQDGSHSAPKSRRLRLVERGEVDGLDYNDDEATERTPMPHLYPSPEPVPLPSVAAADQHTHRTERQACAIPLPFRNSGEDA